MQQAYQRFFDAPLESIFVTRTALLERVSWAWNRLGVWLDELPPFWSVFAMTLTETFGASLLALPIALASIGPLAGIVFLIVFGIVNVLTVGHMAETASRSGGMRYGNAFLGQVVDDYLGRAGSLLLSISLLALLLLVLLAFYIGFATALTEPTRISPQIWVALLFVVGLYFVTRGSLSATVTSALVIGTINISLVIILIVMAASRINLDNLTYVNLPFIGGRPFDASLLELIFGVVFASYFGHLSVPNSARTVLHRDPSGGALVRGAMAAQAVIIVIYSIWILVVNSAIAPSVMAAEKGTALGPLAAEVGPLVHVFGTIFVVLGMGMITIHFSLGLFNLTREWLPLRKRPALTLLRRKGQLHFRPRGKPSGLPHIQMVYLGQEDEQPHFRMDIQTNTTLHRVEITIAEHWDIATLFESYPDLNEDGRRLQLAVDVLRVDSKLARLRITTPLAITYTAGRDSVGLRMTDLLTLPEDQGQLVRWMMNEGRVSLSGVAAQLSQTPEATQAVLKVLLAEGYVRELEVEGALHYEAFVAPTRPRRLSQELVRALTDTPLDTPARAASARKLGAAQGALPRILDAVLSERGRYLLGLVPMTIIFIVAEGLLLTGRQSFSGPLGFIGVIVVALLGGIYPILLLHASRQKGEIVPGVVYHIIGHPLLLIGIYILSLTGIILHGLFIWVDPFQRGLALFVAAVIIGVTITIWRRESFRPRIIVEVCAQDNEDDSAVMRITSGGQPRPVIIRLGYSSGEQQRETASKAVPEFSNLRTATFDLPAGAASELKVWAHKLTADGGSQGLPVAAALGAGKETVQLDLSLSDGQALLALGEQAYQLTLTFPE